MAACTYKLLPFCSHVTLGVRDGQTGDHRPPRARLVGWFTARRGTTSRLGRQAGRKEGFVIHLSRSALNPNLHVGRSKARAVHWPRSTLAVAHAPATTTTGAVRWWAGAVAAAIVRQEKLQFVLCHKQNGKKTRRSGLFAELAFLERKGHRESESELLDACLHLHDALRRGFSSALSAASPCSCYRWVEACTHITGHRHRNTSLSRPPPRYPFINQRTSQ
jgi:hypothetical protein